MAEECWERDHCVPIAVPVSLDGEACWTLSETMLIILLNLIPKMPRALKRQVPYGYLVPQHSLPPVVLHAWMASIISNLKRNLLPDSLIPIGNFQMSFKTYLLVLKKEITLFVHVMLFGKYVLCRESGMWESILRK